VRWRPARSPSPLDHRAYASGAEGGAVPTNVDVHDVQIDNLLPADNALQQQNSPVANSFQTPIFNPLSRRIIHNTVHERQNVDETVNEITTLVSNNNDNLNPTITTLHDNARLPSELQTEARRPNQTSGVLNEGRQQQRVLNELDTRVDVDHMRHHGDPLILDIRLNEMRTHFEMHADDFLHRWIFHVVSLFIGNGGMRCYSPGTSNCSKTVGMLSPRYHGRLSTRRGPILPLSCSRARSKSLGRG